MQRFLNHLGSALLDSGLRRAATGILPSRRIQDFLSINDDEEQKSLVAIPMARLPQSFVNYAGSALLDSGLGRNPVVL